MTDRFLEVSTPSKNLAQGKLRTELWRHFRVIPFRKLIQSESPVLRLSNRRIAGLELKRSLSPPGYRLFTSLRQGLR